MTLLADGSFDVRWFRDSPAPFPSSGRWFCKDGFVFSNAWHAR